MKSLADLGNHIHALVSPTEFPNTIFCNSHMYKLGNSFIHSLCLFSVLC